jgi:hypothetical protein
MTKILTGLAILIAVGSAQTERWVHNYDGPSSGDDWAYSVVYGTDGNVYATGFSESTATGRDFTVISLTSTDSLRWVYRYNGPGNGTDWGNAIVYGQDGNVYAAGVSAGTGTAEDFTVISLTADGAERWIYRVDGAAHSRDEAVSIAYGQDGNVHAAGVTTGSGSSQDLTVVSLDTAGGERWICKYDWTSGADWANSLVYGKDGNLYAGGFSYDSLNFRPCIVLSLTTAGARRWVYRYADRGEIYSVVSDTDGNLCAAGATGVGAAQDFTVIGLTPDGGERWDYKYNGPGDSTDLARSIVCGADGNLYAAGYSTGIETGQDLTVISLTPSGSERWVYRHEGSGFADDWAGSLVCGPGGVVYAAGACYGSTSAADFTVVSLTSAGAERWVYLHDGTGHFFDVGDAVICGADGNVYAAGHTWNNGTNYDFALISLDPAVGVEERKEQPRYARRWALDAPGIQTRRLAFSLSLPAAAGVTVSLYATSGERVLSRQIAAPGGASNWAQDLPALPPGAYFIKAEAGRAFRETKKLILAR